MEPMLGTAIMIGTIGDSGAPPIDPCPVIENNVIRYNGDAENNTSGTVWLKGCSEDTVFAGNRVYGNDAERYLGLVLQNTGGTYQDNIILSGTGGEDGLPLVYCDVPGSKATKFIQNIIAQEGPTGCCGIYVNQFDYVQILCNTLAGFDHQTGGVHLKGAGSQYSFDADIYNNLFENAGLFEMFLEIPENRGFIDIQYNYINGGQGAIAGTHNNYVFLNNVTAGNPALNATRHIMGASCCIDMGMSPALGVPSHDIDGGPRVTGYGMDIGADERAKTNL
jgi:hypothetical protein